MEFSFTAVQIAKILGGQIQGNTHVTVNSIEGIETQNSQAITFLSNEKYEKYLYTTKASIVIVENEFVLQKKIKPTIIRVENSYIAYAILMQTYEKKLFKRKEGIDKSALISDNVKIGKGVYIGAFTYIEEGVKIADNVQIYPHTYIGNEVKIGDDSIIYSGVKIYSKTEIGKKCIVHANAVIGTDGFGFAPLKTGEYIKIPHFGQVIIKDNVEIGANTCIDRGATTSTFIGKGSKLDNLIQIAHNVKIGENTVIASQTGISGSSIIGNNCQIGGQVGISGHIKIGNNVIILGKSGIMGDVSDREKIFGIPATNAKKYFMSVSIFNKLPNLRKQIIKLQKKILSLEKLIKNN